MADHPPGTRKELAEQKPAMETCFGLLSTVEIQFPGCPGVPAKRIPSIAYDL
jgi:hypothetical protein